MFASVRVLFRSPNTAESARKVLFVLECSGRLPKRAGWTHQEDELPRPQTIGTIAGERSMRDFHVTRLVQRKKAFVRCASRERGTFSPLSLSCGSAESEAAAVERASDFAMPGPSRWRQTKLCREQTRPSSSRAGERILRRKEPCES